MPTFSSQRTVLAEKETYVLGGGLARVDCEALQDTFSSRRELVTITVSRDDFLRLRAVGGPNANHIEGALRHYMNVMRQTPHYPLPDSPAWLRGPVMSFLAAIPRHLSDGIRSLSGRFDNHTIRAFRLFLL